MEHTATVIAAGTTVSGNIEGTEDIDIFGMVYGSIRTEGALVVDADARVEAEIVVSSASISGMLVGNVVADELIELTSSAKVQGDLKAPRIVVEDGAAYSGEIDTGGASAGQPTKERGTADRGRRSGGRSAPSRAKSSRSTSRASARTSPTEPAKSRSKRSAPTPKADQADVSNGPDPSPSPPPSSVSESEAM